MINRIALLLILFTIFEGCVSNKKIAESRITNSLDKIEAIACNKFNSDFEIRYNDKASYALVCSSYNGDFINGNHNLNYFVYSIKNKMVVIEDSLTNGEIQMSKKNTIFATEINPDTADNLTKTYQFDMKTKKYRFF
jgi:hypothetical protein